MVLFSLLAGRSAPSTPAKGDSSPPPQGIMDQSLNSLNEFMLEPHHDMCLRMALYEAEIHNCINVL